MLCYSGWVPPAPAAVLFWVGLPIDGLSVPSMARLGFLSIETGLGREQQGRAGRGRRLQFAHPAPSRGVVKLFSPRPGLLPGPQLLHL